MFKFIKRSVALKATVMIFVMVLISALSVGGVILFSGQAQYDEQNFGILDIQSRRIAEESIRYFDEMNQAASIFYNLSLSEITPDNLLAISKNYKELFFIQIYSKNGSLIDSYNFSPYKGKIDPLLPKDLTRPIVIGLGKSIYPPKPVRSEGLPLEKDISVMRVKIDKGSQYLVMGIDVDNHFRRFQELSGDEADLVLFDIKGHIIYHPNPIKRLSHTSKIPYSIRDEFPQLDIDEFFFRGNKSINKTITLYRKEPVYLFYRRVEIGGKFLAGVVYTVPTINLPSFIRSFNQKQILLIILLVSLLPLLAWPMLKYLFRDLQEITHKAQLYTNGEQDISIDVHSQDEIGVLALTFQGMIRQVNERTRFLRKSERRIREARDQAEQALSSKSHLLEDLREQKAEIERVSKDKDDLLAIVSHDLKNPLAVIETSMDLIMEEEKDSLTGVTHDLVRRSKNSARIALNLITDLLDLARLEGGIKLDFEKFKVDDLIDNVVDAYYLKAKEKNILVHIDRDTSYDIIADYGRVVQVVSNILGNALKFTPEEGRIDIRIRTYETQQVYEGTNLGLELIISDTGPGIPKNKLASIFNKFEQARENDRKIGTGLGLTIVKNICELHNGGISVDSEEGEGAVFTIRLPRLLQSSAQVTESSSREDTSRIIFIANDDELFRKRIRKIFSDSSYKVAEATNGEEVLLYLDKHNPDLIILDHEMPVKDGLSAWLEYTEGHLCSIPVILLSDNVEGVDPQWLRNNIYDILPAQSSPEEIENRAISILYPNQLTSLDKKLDPTKKTVLIVDDEDAIRNLLQESISANGYNCMVAKNGVEGLFLIQKYRINLVISDIRMSEGDGILLTKAVKKELPDLPVALMSAAIDGISENVAKKLGVECLITKPFDLDQFCGYIVDMIGGADLEAWTDIYSSSYQESTNESSKSEENTEVEGARQMQNIQESNISKDTPHTPKEDIPEISKISNISKEEAVSAESTAPSSRVLLADDSSDMQILFKLLLRKENIDLEVVENGKLAVEKIESQFKNGQVYDTIFMDLNMPEMNGDIAVEYIRQLEKDHGHLEQRIVLLSASSDEEGKALLEKGFDSFIQKPINKEKILKEVQNSKQ